jgi:hypothetical protein
MAVVFTRVLVIGGLNLRNEVDVQVIGEMRLSDVWAAFADLSPRAHIYPHGISTDTT